MTNIEEPKDEKYEQMIQIIKDIYSDDDDYRKYFMNPGIIEKKFIIQQDNWEKYDNSYSEQKHFLEHILRKIISESFTHISIEKSITIDASNRFYNDSYSDIVRLIKSIQIDIEQDENMMNRQINKTRFLFYGTKHQNILMESLIKQSNTILGIEKVYIPALEYIYLSSGPILDLNSFELSYQTDLELNKERIQIITPIAKNYIVRIETDFGNEKSFLRRKKLENLIK